MLNTETRTPAPALAFEAPGGAVALRSMATHWLAALEGGLEVPRQAHFLSTFTPALVQHFKAEEEALDLARTRGRLRHRREHHRLAARLMTLMNEHARGRSVAKGIQHFLEAWLLHQEGDLGATASRFRGH